MIELEHQNATCKKITIVDLLLDQPTCLYSCEITLVGDYIVSINYICFVKAVLFYKRWRRNQKDQRNAIGQHSTNPWLKTISYMHILSLSLTCWGQNPLCIVSWFEFEASGCQDAAETRMTRFLSIPLFVIQTPWWAQCEWTPSSVALRISPSHKHYFHLRITAMARSNDLNERAIKAWAQLRDSNQQSNKNCKSLWLFICTSLEFHFLTQKQSSQLGHFLSVAPQRITASKKPSTPAARVVHAIRSSQFPLHFKPLSAEKMLVESEGKKNDLCIVHKQPSEALPIPFYCRMQASVHAEVLSLQRAFPVNASGTFMLQGDAGMEGSNWRTTFTILFN